MESRKNAEIKAKLLEYHYQTSNKQSRVGDYSGLKAQKFLFFYNAFSMLDGKPYTDNMLFAYKDGPVYYDILHLSRDRTTPDVVNFLKIGSDFSDENDLDEKNLTTALNLTELFPSDELSEITHNLEVWKKKYSKFKQNHEKSQFTFNEFTKDDLEYLDDLRNVFSPELYERFNIVFGNEFSYLIEKENYHYILETLGGVEKVKEIKSEFNPIYIYVEEGEIIID